VGNDDDGVFMFFGFHEFINTLLNQSFTFYVSKNANTMVRRKANEKPVSARRSTYRYPRHWWLHRGLRFLDVERALLQ
jgi:hypothetical protein